MAEPNGGSLAKNPAYRPATEKALETGLFLWLLFHRRLVRLAPWRARRRFRGTARRKPVGGCNLTSTDCQLRVDDVKLGTEAG